MIDAWLEALGKAIQNNFWAAPLLALGAGLLTSFAPCSLSTIPLVIGYVGYMKADYKKAFRLSVTFAFGAALTFTGLGVGAALLGRMIGTASRWWYLLLGTLMIMMALQTWDILQFAPSTYLTAQSTKTRYSAAFLAGLL